MTLYFAYGSNVDLDDVDRWCLRHGHTAGRLHPVAVAWWPDHRLCFDYRSRARGGGALNLKPAPGHAAPGACMTVDPGGWADPGGGAALDAKEGVAGGWYQRLDSEALTADGAAHTARTYVVQPSHRVHHSPPTPGYLDLVRRGRERWGVPDVGQLDAAAAGPPPPGALPLFVYGTLRRGGARHDLVAHARQREPATVPGSLWDFGDWPGLRIRAEGDPGRVVGELVDLPPDDGETLQRIDEFEGFRGFGIADSLFHRRLIQATTAWGSSVLAWVYLVAGVGGRALLGGDWMNRARKGGPACAVD